MIATYDTQQLCIIGSVINIEPERKSVEASMEQ